MKNILLSLLLFLVCSFANAQNRQLENYGFEIKLEAKNNQLLIQNQEKIDTFGLNVDFSLKNVSDTNKVIRTLRFDNNHLKDLYNQYLEANQRNKANLIQALVERSQSVPELRIIFVDAQQGTSDTSDVVDELVPISSVEENDAPSPFGKWTWIAMLLGGLAGGLLVYLLAKPKTQKVVSSNETENAKSSNDDNALANAKSELANIKTTLKKRLEFDEQYFNKSFDTIIKPLENALEAKDTSAIIPLLIQAMAQYSALTRFKLEKKQSFDQTNMEILLGTKTYSRSDYPKIDKSTSPDSIPNKLKTLIELLQHAQAKGVDNAIVSGYKIQDL